MLNIQLAAMTITWANPSNEDLSTFFSEVKTAGYTGVAGFAEGNWETYIDNPDDFRRPLNDYGLSLASLDIKVHRDLDFYRKTCNFMAQFDCKHLVCLGGVDTTVDNYVELADVLNDIGEIALEYGVRAVYHNGRTRETFEDMTTVLTHVDPSKVFAMCDLGHATRDFIEYPVAKRVTHFLKTYWDRIDFIEFKDMSDETELNTPVGEGLTDWETIFAFLKEKNYTGWITVEQNSHQELSKGRSPLECATISRDFIRQGLGIQFTRSPQPPPSLHHAQPTNTPHPQSASCANSLAHYE